QTMDNASHLNEFSDDAAYNGQDNNQWNHYAQQRAEPIDNYVGNGAHRIVQRGAFRNPAADIAGLFNDWSGINDNAVAGTEGTNDDLAQHDVGVKENDRYGASRLVYNLKTSTFRTVVRPAVRRVEESDEKSDDDSSGDFNGSINDFAEMDTP
ncbi:hypothetical protein PFISCL1PPCAC_20990, partial [Pristionchus fissidentatus]